MTEDLAGTGSRTSIIAAPTTADAAPQDRADCMACSHSPDTHDKIALRYCDATVARALTRGCICRAPAPA
jgi:hypothetical protein